jgi:hypothetical protein
MFTQSLRLSVAAVLGVAALPAANAAVVITEVSSKGNDLSYAADWFEVTNTGASPVDLTGWKVDDSSGSNGTGNARTITGINALAAGQSAIVFLEVDAGGALNTVTNNFITAWFGSAGAPANLLFGNASGSGLGLSAGDGDSVYVWDASNVLQTWVQFAGGDSRTFDNASGSSGGPLAFSQLGVNGAFISADNNELGSPGFATSPVPLPAGAWLLLSGLGALGAAARRRKS